MRNRLELVAVLSKKLGEKTNEEWNRVFEGARFPYGAVNSLKEVFNDPQVMMAAFGVECTMLVRSFDLP